MPQVREATTVSALAAYVGDASAAGPLTAPATQRAVGVHVPAGAPSSYVAGTTYAVDLSSWSYSTPTDARDTTVDVTIGGRAAGTFAVDNTLADDTYDAHGTVAVRATIPVDLPAGATTVVVAGTTTGTSVRLPVVVTAAPAPEPTPEPTPTPAAVVGDQPPTTAAVTSP